MIKKVFNIIISFFSNVFSKSDVCFITEDKSWVVYYVCSQIKKNLDLKVRISHTHLGLRNQIVHFGSINTFLKEKSCKKVHKSNKVVVTWFHFVPENKRNINILKAKNDFIIHTSCSITKQKLIGLGILEKKIIVIPIGIDNNVFQKRNNTIDIPKDRIIIGSFQKDGVGWKEGFVPKLVKGPDLFVKAVEKISEKHPVFVVLTGPSRGYVKKELEKRKIPFKYFGFLKSQEEVARFYNALDLYIISSRIEGGPKAILEAMSSEIPVVSTKVGMVVDIVQDKEMLAETRADDIAKKAIRIIEDKDLRERLIREGKEVADNYTWDKIAKRYYNEIYDQKDL